MREAGNRARLGRRRQNHAISRQSELTNSPLPIGLKSNTQTRLPSGRGRLVSNATAENPKEQLKSTIDRVIEVLRTIRGPQDIEKNMNSLRQILLTRFDYAPWRSSRWGIAGTI